eukprot:2365889-Amphidinium_carterae.1
MEEGPLVGSKLDPHPQRVVPGYSTPPKGESLGTPDWGRDPVLSDSPEPPRRRPNVAWQSPNLSTATTEVGAARLQSISVTASSSTVIQGKALAHTASQDPDGRCSLETWAGAQDPAKSSVSASLDWHVAHVQDAADNES